MTEAMVEVVGLRVELGGSCVLDQLSFALMPGEMLAVVGPNGAGKSTLLRCLDGLLPVRAGTVTVGGRPIAALSRRELARRVSYVPQGASGLGELGVRTFVELGRYPYLGAWQSPGTEDLAAVGDALRVTETEHLGERRLDTLSGGERQRVLIAAALAQGGRVLLLDEPTTYLDYRHQAQTVELLNLLHRERGLTVIIVSHDLNAVVPDADRVLALRQGRMAYLGPASEFMDPGILLGVFDARFMLARGEGGQVVVLPCRSAR